MAHCRARTNAVPLVAAAAASYATTCAVGAAVALRLIDTSRIRWVHHALYVATCAVGAAAVGSEWLSRSPSAGRRVALALLPAFVPLGLIPHVGTHTRRHPIVALAAAPFFIASVLLSRHRPQRR